ncbi:hypothetical protein HDU86_000462 [Geranomyces michiganensis]|nr:hypothetical protein HDU86_000462 [Geranomyces michiganensis]
MRYPDIHTKILHAENGASTPRGLAELQIYLPAMLPPEYKDDDEYHHYPGSAKIESKAVIATSTEVHPECVIPGYKTEAATPARKKARQKILWQTRYYCDKAKCQRVKQGADAEREAAAAAVRAEKQNNGPSGRPGSSVDIDGIGEANPPMWPPNDDESSVKPEGSFYTESEGGGEYGVDYFLEDMPDSFKEAYSEGSRASSVDDNDLEQGQGSSHGSTASNGGYEFVGYSFDNGPIIYEWHGSDVDVEHEPDTIDTISETDYDETEQEVLEIMDTTDLRGWKSKTF